MSINMNNMPPMNQFNILFPPNINQFNPFQNNFMAPNPININNMILNYENRIRSLENEIKEKDKRIAYLQEQLNQSYKSKVIDENQIVQENGDILVAIQLNIQKIKCFKNQNASIIEKKLNLQNIKITYNYKPIEYTKTIEENGIYDGSIINLTNQIYNIDFEKYGKHCLISLDGECPIKTAIISYCEKNGEKNLYFDALNKKITFIYRDIIYILDDIPIKNIFNKNFNPRVTVLL